MDDLIYILVIIAWLAFTIYRRNQVKRKAGETTASPGKRIPIPTLDEILTDDEARTPEIIPEEPTPKGMGRSYAGRHADSQEGISLEEAFGSAETEEVPLKVGAFTSQVAADREEDRPAAPEEPEAFDARQAVIYSEIMNRPYL